MIDFIKRILKGPIKKNNPVQEELIIEEQLDIYHEQEVEEETTVFEVQYTIDKMREMILDDFTKSERRLAKLNKDYYILKLFSRAAIKTGRFNEKMLHLDKQVNYTKRLYEELKRKMDIVKYMQDVTMDELNEINEKIKKYLSFLSQIQTEADEINRVHYTKIKLASAGIIINKNNIELEKFNREVNDFIYQYKSLQEAAEYVYYHSGDLIVETVKTLVQSIEQAKNPEHIQKYDFNFFLESSLVLTLTLPQWIELFNKIRYVLRTTSEVNVISYVDFKNNYQKLEVRYFILMLYMESKSKDDFDNSKITDFYI